MIKYFWALILSQFSKDPECTISFLVGLKNQLYMENGEIFMELTSASDPKYKDWVRTPKPLTKDSFSALYRRFIKELDINKIQITIDEDTLSMRDWIKNLSVKI